MQRMRETRFSEDRIMRLKGDPEKAKEEITSLTKRAQNAKRYEEGHEAILAEVNIARQTAEEALMHVENDYKATRSHLTALLCNHEDELDKANEELRQSEQRAEAVEKQAEQVKTTAKRTEDAKHQVGIAEKQVEVLGQQVKATLQQAEAAEQQVKAMQREAEVASHRAHDTCVEFMVFRKRFAQEIEVRVTQAKDEAEAATDMNFLYTPWMSHPELDFSIFGDLGLRVVERFKSEATSSLVISDELPLAMEMHGATSRAEPANVTEVSSSSSSDDSLLGLDPPQDP